MNRALLFSRWYSLASRREESGVGPSSLRITGRSLFLSSFGRVAFSVAYVENLAALRFFLSQNIATGYSTERGCRRRESAAFRRVRFSSSREKTKRWPAPVHDFSKKKRVLVIVSENELHICVVIFLQRRYNGSFRSIDYRTRGIRKGSCLHVIHERARRLVSLREIISSSP